MEIQSYLFMEVVFHENKAKEWLGYKTNTKIGDRQALEHQFCRRMERSYLTKGNQNEKIAKGCGDGKKHIYEEEWKHPCRWKKGVSVFSQIPHLFGVTGGQQSTAQEGLLCNVSYSRAKKCKMALHHKTDENLYRLNRSKYKSMHVTTDVLQKIHPSLNNE